MREKINSSEITVIIFKVFKKCKSLIQKKFKSAELLTKASFFLYFRDCPKMAKETNKRDGESIRAKVTKDIKKGDES